MSARVPHFRTVVIISAAAIAGYLGFSLWVVLISRDAALIGDVVGTWKSFAVGAFAFWIGSSSAGKARPVDTPPPSDSGGTSTEPDPAEEPRS